MLVTTGMREKRFTVCGANPVLLVVVNDEGAHIFKKGWFKMVPSSRYHYISSLDTKGRAMMKRIGGIST